MLLSLNADLDLSRYFRLMALAALEILLTVPLASYIVYLNLTAAPVRPWISWADTHSNFNRYDQYPAAVWRRDPRSNVLHELSRWDKPLCAFVFFAFFGFADEARKHYRTAATTTMTKLGFRTTMSYVLRTARAPSYADVLFTAVHRRRRRISRCTSTAPPRSGASRPSCAPPRGPCTHWTRAVRMSTG